jgi:glyoxylase-like metal-dependent hydrolase (beta-lactamase superfamily II)
MSTLHGAPPRFDAGLREVAAGVHAWMQPNGTWGESNAGLVVGEGESLLVDTLWTPALTRRMLEAMAPVVAAAPIRTLVNTHADGDHTWGNQELAGAEIVASEAAKEELGELTPGSMAGFRKLAGVLSAGRRLRVPGGAAGPYVQAMLRPFDFGDVEVTPPTRTFEGSLELEVGGRPVELIQVGPAHTQGDLLVWIPDARVVFAADVMFVGVTPVMWAGPVERWIAALDRIESLDPAVVVPGHGPVCGLDEVRALKAWWTGVDEAARLHYAEGRSPLAAARALIAEGGDWTAWDGPERLVISLHTIYRHLSGDTGGVSPLQRIKIFAEVGQLAAERR